MAVFLQKQFVLVVHSFNVCQYQVVLYCEDDLGESPASLLHSLYFSFLYNCCMLDYSIDIY